MNLRCSIVIPTKNGGELFQHALANLKSQKIWPQVELIVIDSGSTDGTIQAASNAGAKVVSIPPAEFNHGATRDFGISLASGDLIVLMVQDAVVEGTEMLDAILSPFSDLEVAGVYARQKPQDSADLLTKRNLNSWLTGRKDREVRQMKSLEWYEALPPYEKYCYCNFDNVCSAIRKSVWQQHNFGTNSFGEDIEWAERVLKAGWKIVYEPNATVIHSHDRPINYEYKRTYVCHRKLHDLFDLSMTPNIMRAVMSWVISTSRDLHYVVSQSAPLSAKCSLLAKIPFLNLYCVTAQYRAAKDASKGKIRTVTGV